MTMLELGKMNADGEARVCAGRGSVCDWCCRAEELTRRTLDRLLRQGWRLA